MFIQNNNIIIFKSLNDLSVEKGLRMLKQLIRFLETLQDPLDKEFYTFAFRKLENNEYKYYLPFFAGSIFTDLFNCHLSTLKELYEKLNKCYENHPDCKVIWDCVYYYGV